MTLSPSDPATVAIVLSTAGRASDGCRLWNWPRLPKTSRCGATRTPASNRMLPDVASVLAAKPPTPVMYPRSPCARDGAAHNNDNVAATNNARIVSPPAVVTIDDVVTAMNVIGGRNRDASRLQYRSAARRRDLRTRCRASGRRTVVE